MTLDLDLLPDGGVPWLDAIGPEGHIVLSTRIRLARNLRGHQFPPRADDAERETVREQVLTAVRESGRSGAASWSTSIGSPASSGSCSTNGT